jgi:hypothetical protein
MVKSASKFAFRYAGGLSLVRRLHRQGLRILMYHRFSDRAALARQCAHIRKHYHPVSMATVSEWLHIFGSTFRASSVPPILIIVPERPSICR